MIAELSPKYKKILTKYKNMVTDYPELKLDFNYFAITEIIDKSTPKELKELAKLNMIQLTNIVYDRLMENRIKIRIDFTTILELQYLPASHNDELAIIIQKAYDRVNSGRLVWHSSAWIEITEQQRDFLINLIKSNMNDGTNMKWTAKAYHAILQLNGQYKTT